MTKENSRVFQITEKDVLYEDNHLLVVNKKAGIPVQGDQSGDPALTDLVRDFLRIKYDKPGNIFAGLPHRIDRPVSGVVIICKTSKSLSRVTEAFRKKQVKKTYLALVSNKPRFEKETLIHWIQKDPTSNKVRVFLSEKSGALESQLDYEVIATHSKYFLLKIDPLTGRPHQIRAQLAKINCPIEGDLKYGSANPAPDRSIYLHARAIEFLHPVKKELVKISSPLPHRALWKLFKGINYN